MEDSLDVIPNVDPVNPPIGFNTVQHSDYKNAHTDNSGFVNKCCINEYTWRGATKRECFQRTTRVIQPSP